MQGNDLLVERSCHPATTTRCIASIYNGARDREVRERASTHVVEAPSWKTRQCQKRFLVEAKLGFRASLKCASVPEA